MMKLSGAILWLLLVVGAYGLGAEYSARTKPVATSTTSFEAALGHSDPLSRSFEISRSLRAVGVEDVGDVVEAVN